MSGVKSNHIEAVGGVISRLLLGMRSKDAERALETSPQTVQRLKRGDVGSAEILIKAIRYWGVRVIEPVTGPIDTASLARRLDSILAEVGEIHDVVSSKAIAVPASSPHGLLGSGGGAGEEGQKGGDGEVRGAGRNRGEDHSRLALVQVRRPLAGLTGRGAAGAQLAEHLTANVYSLDAARAYKAKHPDIGIAYKPPGMDWMVDPSDRNRLWLDHAGPRPLTAFPFPEYVSPLRKGFEEAARSVDPILIEHTGYLHGEHIHATVLRFGGIANDGTELCLAAHERSA